MAARGRPPGNGANQRDRILRATTPLIVEHGAAKVRLRDVAAGAGVSVGMIQHYFPTREHLIDAAFGRYSLDVVDRLNTLAPAGEAPWERLVALCRAAASANRVRERSIIWFDFVGQASRDPARRRTVRQVYQAWLDAFEQVVQDGMDSGDFDPVVEPLVVAEQLVAMVDGLDVAVAIQLPRATRAWREERLLTVARALLRRRS